jgi:hypothetical protein
MQGLTHKFFERAQAILERAGLATPVSHVATGLGPDAWELGELQVFAILEPDATTERFKRFGSVTLLDLRDRGVRLYVSGQHGSQIHCVGGKQHLNLDALGVPPERRTSPVVIGPVERIRYASTRSGERVEYEHMFGYEFGSDYSELPVLIYDAHDKRMELVGGVYRVGRTMGVIC